MPDIRHVVQLYFKVNYKFLEQEKKEKKFNFIDIVYNTITIQMCDVNLPFSVSFPPKHGSERV